MTMELKKPGKKKKAKKKNDPYTKRYMETLFRKAVLKRWGNQCAYCGTTENLNAHHLIYKSQSGLLKYDVRNGILGCVEHHDFYHTEYGRIWCAEKIGPEEYEYLCEMDSMTIPDYCTKMGIGKTELKRNMQEALKEYIG